MKELKKIFPTAHLEIKSNKSSLADAISYCMKDGDYIEFGVRPRQGQRTDLELIRYDLEKNVPMIDIAKNNFSKWCQYRRAFTEYSDMIKVRNPYLIIYENNSLETWKKLSQYMKGKYIVLQQLLNAYEVHHYYYGKVYDYIITPATTFTEVYVGTKDKNVIFI